jgi:hypothetical protein
MTLDKFVESLQKLQAEGHGSRKVFYRHGASGDCGELSTAYIDTYVDDSTGPFDLADNEEYVAIYAGN